MSVEVTPGAQHARREGWSRWAGWIAAAAAGALGFGLVYANTIVSQLDTAYHVGDVSGLVTAPPTAPGDRASAGAGKPLTILLMGSDSRAGANGAIGGRVADGMRNDTTIVMHISADRSRVDLVSIPRDAQVAIPACKRSDGSVSKATTGDFNIAFSQGGLHGDTASAAACAINAVHDLTGLTIDHYAVVDFVGFENMINALGGVPMCIPERIDSTKARLHLNAGPQVLDGREALAFARLRTAEVGQVSGSDLQRINRQHELLRQVARTALSKNYLTDAGQLTLFIRSAARSLTMDPGLANTKYLLSLAYSLKSMDPNNIRFATVPWKLTKDGLNVILLDTGAQMWKDMANDVPLSVVAKDNAGSAWDTGRKAGSSSPAAVAPGDATAALLSECR